MKVKCLAQDVTFLDLRLRQTWLRMFYIARCTVSGEATGLVSPACCLLTQNLCAAQAGAGLEGVPAAARHLRPGSPAHEQAHLPTCPQVPPCLVAR